jgi:hypothetical protein
VVFVNHLHFHRFGNPRKARNGRLLVGSDGV